MLSGGEFPAAHFNMGRFPASQQDQLTIQAQYRTTSWVLKEQLKDATGQKTQIFQFFPGSRIHAHGNNLIISSLGGILQALGRTQYRSGQRWR